MIASIASIFFSENEENKNEMNIQNNESKFVYCCASNINQQQEVNLQPTALTIKKQSAAPISKFWTPAIVYKYTSMVSAYQFQNSGSQHSTKSSNVFSTGQQITETEL